MQAAPPKKKPLTAAIVIVWGGAACIASACDFRIASTNSILGYPEINLGINLNWLGLPLAVRLIGPAKAKKMVIGGKNENADTLLSWGF
jgi:enoyl-CoA hydratase/carnithine racemase